MSGFQPPHQPDPYPDPSEQSDPGPASSGQPYPRQSFPGELYPGYPLPATGPVPLDQPHYGAGFVDAVKRFWRKYATFTGRASRSEFWWWQLANLMVAAVLGVATSVISTSTALSGGDPITNLTRLTRTTSLVATIPAHVWALAVLLPTVAVTVRRLHDTGRSGWWYLPAVPAQLYNWVSLAVPVTTYLPIHTAPGGLPTFPPAFWVLLLASALTGAGAIVVLILCIFAPKPAGARFDRH